MINLNLDKRSGVYVIRAADQDLVKIGRAVDVAKRLSTLQIGSPVDLILERVIETNGCSEAVEKKLHHIYRTKRVRGEWFRLTKQEVFDMPDWDSVSGNDRRAMRAFLDGLGVT